MQKDVLIYLELILVIFPLDLKKKFFLIFSFLWTTLVAFRICMIQSLCVDCMNALRCVCSVNNRTHCDIITSLCNQFPLILSLKKRFIQFIINCLVCQNNIVKIISQTSICNPMRYIGQ